VAVSEGSAGPPRPPTRPGRQAGWGTGAGAASHVPMESVWEPDTRTLAEWRASPAGEHSPRRRVQLTVALAAIEAAIDRSRTAGS
jgi:hypothetical protein